MSERRYRIDELAHAAGMSVRTVRYYVQRGLLPPAAFRGKDTAYDHAHLTRLRAIRRLQEAFFPLDAIAVELEGRSLHEIEQIADGKVKPVSPLGAEHQPQREREREREPGHERDEPARAAIAHQAGQPSRLFRRIELFPGVDLTVAEDAPAQSVRLVKEMLAILEEMSRERAREAREREGREGRDGREGGGRKR